MAIRRSKTNRRALNQRRKGRRNHGNAKWYLAIVICTALVVGVMMGSQLLISKARIDETTLCHTSGALNVTAILLDLTDPLSSTQQKRLSVILEREFSSSDTDTMISLGVVSEDPAKWGAQFTKCKPETGETANALYENPTIIAQRYAREFVQPVHATLTSMLTGKAENRSPIMEALQSLISQTPSFTSVRGQRKIIIVSDMLQNSGTLSFYSGHGWDYFAKNNGVARLAGNLSGVTVKIIRIPRSGHNIPSNDITEGFWSRYFDKQGSRPPTVTSLGDL